MNEFLKVTIGDDYEVLRYKNRVMVLETLYTPLKHYVVIESMRLITKHWKFYSEKKKMYISTVIIQKNARMYVERKRFLRMKHAANIIIKNFEKNAFKNKLKVLERVYNHIATKIYAIVIRRRFLRIKRACIMIQKTFIHMQKIKLRNYGNMLLKIREMEEEKKRSEITTKKLQSQITNMRRINKRKKLLN